MPIFAHPKIAHALSLFLRRTIDTALKLQCLICSPNTTTLLQLTRFYADSLPYTSQVLLWIWCCFRIVTIFPIETKMPYVALFHLFIHPTFPLGTRFFVFSNLVYTSYVEEFKITLIITPKYLRKGYQRTFFDTFFSLPPPGTKRTGQPPASYIPWLALSSSFTPSRQRVGVAVGCNSLF